MKKRKDQNGGYESFNPPQEMRVLLGNYPTEDIAGISAKLAGATVQVLRDKLRDQHGTGLFPEGQGIAWLLAQELQARGLAPRWFGLGSHDPLAEPKYSALQWRGTTQMRTHDDPVPLGLAYKRKLLARWCDLAWLRRELGPSHVPSLVARRALYRDDTAQHHLEAIYSELAHSDEPVVRILDDLAVPDAHRLALAGFRCKKAAERVKAVNRRLKDRIGPALDGLSQRKTYALSADRVATRMVYAEAIELSCGRPTEAATFVRWISGESVSPQAVHCMRPKIAKTAGLTGKAWQVGNR